MNTRVLLGSESSGRNHESEGNAETGNRPFREHRKRTRNRHAVPFSLFVMRSLGAHMSCSPHLVIPHEEDLSLLLSGGRRMPIPLTDEIKSLVDGPNFPRFSRNNSSSACWASNPRPEQHIKKWQKHVIARGGNLVVPHVIGAGKSKTARQPPS